MSSSFRKFPRTFLVFILLIGQVLLMTIPSVSAADPCQANGGACDEWSHSLDQTPNAQSWVEADYQFSMVSTSQLDLSFDWAIHEFNRDAVQLPGISLGSGSDDNRDGIPVDYIRNFINDRPGGGGTPTVGDLLLDEVNDVVSDLLSSGFNASVTATVDWANTANIDGNPEICTQDPGFDSNGEDGSQPIDPYNPPMCVRVTAQVSLPSSSFNIDAGADVERAYKGLLTMGAEITSDFTLKSPAGHDSIFSIYPPAYASVVNQTPEHATPNEDRGKWYIDFKDGFEGATDEELSVTMSMSRKDDATTSAVNIDIATEEGLDVVVTLDLTNEQASRIDIDIGLRYIDAATMNSWGINLVDVAEDAYIPWVTSDGIRLAYDNGMVDPTDFTDNFPIGSITDGLNEFLLEGSSIVMGDLEMLSANSTGGLNFSHNIDATETCDETSIPANPLHFCVEGENAMNGDYPIYLHSQSNAFKMSLMDMLKDMLDLSASGIDLSEITEEDIRAVLNSGLSGEVDFGSDFLSGFIPDGMPPTSITTVIMLPQQPTPWIATADGESVMIISDIIDPSLSDQTMVSFGGSNIWNWRHPIVDEFDRQICAADQPTCFAMNVEFDAQDFSIHEWSQEISMTLSASIELEVYRLDIPNEITDYLHTDQGSLDFDVVPSDLIRLLVDLAGRQSSPLNTTFDVEGEEKTLYFTNEGLHDFAGEMGDLISSKLHDYSSDNSDIDIDLSNVYIDIQLGDLSAPNPGNMSDDIPLSIKVTLQEATYTIGVDLENKKGKITTSAIHAPIANSLLRLSNQVAVNGGGNGIVISDDGNGFTTSVDSPTIAQSGEEYEPQVNLAINLPPGLEFGEFTSSLGLSELGYSDDGRQQRLLYTMPPAGQSDDISFTLKITWGFILAEIWAYIAIPILLVGFLIYRRRQKKKKKKEKRAQKVWEADDANLKDYGGWNDAPANPEPVVEFDLSPGKVPPPIEVAPIEPTKVLPATPYGGKGQNFDDLLGRK
jgi:hypothetical protein